MSVINDALQRLERHDADRPSPQAAAPASPGLTARSRRPVYSASAALLLVAAFALAWWSPWSDSGPVTQTAVASNVTVTNVVETGSPVARTREPAQTAPPPAAAPDAPTDIVEVGETAGFQLAQAEPAPSAPVKERGQLESITAPTTNNEFVSDLTAAERGKSADNQPVLDTPVSAPSAESPESLTASDVVDVIPASNDLAAERLPVGSLVEDTALGSAESAAEDVTALTEQVSKPTPPPKFYAKSGRVSGGAHRHSGYEWSERGITRLDNRSIRSLRRGR